MNLKEIFWGAVYLPATAVSGFTGFIFGGYEKDENGVIVPDCFGNPTTTPNILGRVADLAGSLSRAVGNFFDNHKNAIATAFWASLALTAAAVVTLFLLPEILAVVTGFTIAGFSIAGIVGTGLIPQLAAVGVLTTAATSALVYAGATVINGINALVSLFKSEQPVANTSQLRDETTSSAAATAQLGGSVSSFSTATAPVQTTNVFRSAPANRADEDLNAAPVLRA